MITLAQMRSAVEHRLLPLLMRQEFILERQLEFNDYLFDSYIVAGQIYINSVLPTHGKDLPLMRTPKRKLV